MARKTTPLPVLPEPAPVSRNPLVQQGRLAPPIDPLAPPPAGDADAQAAHRLAREALAFRAFHQMWNPSANVVVVEYTLGGQVYHIATQSGQMAHSEDFALMILGVLRALEEVQARVDPGSTLPQGKVTALYTEREPCDRAQCRVKLAESPLTQGTRVYCSAPYSQSEGTVAQGNAEVARIVAAGKADEARLQQQAMTDLAAGKVVFDVIPAFAPGATNTIESANRDPDKSTAVVQIKNEVTFVARRRVPSDASSTAGASAVA